MYDCIYIARSMARPPQIGKELVTSLPGDSQNHNHLLSVGLGELLGIKLSLIDFKKSLEQ